MTRTVLGVSIVDYQPTRAELRFQPRSHWSRLPTAMALLKSSKSWPPVWPSRRKHVYMRIEIYKSLHTLAYRWVYMLRYGNTSRHIYIYMDTLVKYTCTYLWICTHTDISERLGVYAYMNIQVHILLSMYTCLSSTLTGWWWIVGPTLTPAVWTLLFG